MRFLFGLILLSTSLFSCTSGNTKSEKASSKTWQQEIPEGTIALFDGESMERWEITNFGTQGPVRISEGKIVIGMGEGCSGITWKESFPKVNYEIGLEARKTAGNDFFCGLTFPVNESFCSLIVGGWGGPVVGLSIIDGLDASENETRSLMKFDRDTWYPIRLLVNDSLIIANINGEEVVRFNYQGREIGIRPEVSLSRPLGICTWMTRAEIKNLWYRELAE